MAKGRRRVILILSSSFITKQRVSYSVLDIQMTLLLALSLYPWGRSQALSVYPSQGFREKAHLSNPLSALSGLPLSLPQKLLMLAPGLITEIPGLQQDGNIWLPEHVDPVAPREVTEEPALPWAGLEEGTH